jgi:hypothetical protein
VYAGCATNGLGGRRRNANPERLERQGFLDRPIPDGDMVTAFDGGVHEPAAKKSGAEISGVRHS